MYENRYNKQLQEAFEAGYRKALNETDTIPIELRPDQEQLVDKEFIGVPVPKPELTWTGTVPIVTIILEIIAWIWEEFRKLNPMGWPGMGNPW